MLHKFFKIILCAFVITSIICFPTVSAAGDGIITADTVSAIRGDTVTVNFCIADNPGIMAITVSITYDSAALTYKKYSKGILSDYMVYNHPDKGIVRFVSCEKNDNSSNGNLISIQFKVNETASAGLHKISIEYSDGDFCNWNQQSLFPGIVPGGVNVSFNGENCTHKTYGEWQDTVKPTCTEDGVRQRFCTVCGHCETGVIKKLGHDFENFWTVDSEATADNSGQISRHCKRCDEKTDIIAFSATDVKDNSIDNEIGTQIEPNDFTGEIKQPVTDDTPPSDSVINEAGDSQNEESKAEHDSKAKVIPFNILVLTFIMIVLIVLIKTVMYII